MNSKKGPPKPPPAVVLWQIQTETGKQLGPIATEEVLKQISEGKLRGGEKIKRHPDGSWVVISKQPQFYDKLLDALEEVSKSKTEAVKIKTPSSGIVVSPPPPSDSENKVKLSNPVFEPLEPVLKREPDPLPERKPPSQTVIELQDINKIKTKQKIRDSVLPMALLFGSIILGAVAYFWPTAEENFDKPRLILPHFQAEATMKPDQVKALLAQALSAFQVDSFEGYWEAQTKLVTLLEKSSQTSDARGLLCLVYKELWPHVRQDSKDLEAIQVLAKTTKSMDPIGINGVYCESALLMVLGKYPEARGVLDQALNQTTMSAAPVLLMMKAEILASEKDYRSAILYAEKAVQLWPQWVKQIFTIAMYYSATGQSQQALDNFEKTLQLNVKHRVAQIEYANLLYTKFRRIDLATNYISAALSSKSKITRLVESKAYMLGALLQQEAKNMTKALEYAKMAYSLNAGDSRARDLILQLGGSPEVGHRGGQLSELVFLGDQYARAGDCLSAQAEYKAAFELDPSNALAATKAAKCLWSLNQSQEAISWLNKAITADKKMAIAYYMLADYQSQRFNLVGATQVLNQGAAQLPNNFEILRGYGLVEFRRNNFKDSVGFLQRALKIFENDLDTVVLLAQAYLALGDYQKAQTHAVRAIEIDSTNSDAQIAYARTLSQFKGVDAGLYYLRELINKFSYTQEYRLALADFYNEAERFKSSEEIYKQLIDLDGRNKKAIMGLASSYQGQGYFDRAIKLYFDAAVVDPSDAEPLFRAGKVYLESNKPNEAMQQFRRGLKINKMYPRGYYLVGKAALLSGNSALALESAQEEKKNNPNLADSYILAAEVYSALRDYQKCAAEYQQALRLRPQGADMYVRISKCYRLSGNLDVAENMLNIAAGQESGYAEIYKEQGAVYEQRGDKRAATQAYSKYIALSPNAPDRKEIESRISVLASGH